MIDFLQRITGIGYRAKLDETGFEIALTRMCQADDRVHKVTMELRAEIQGGLREYSDTEKIRVSKTGTAD